MAKAYLFGWCEGVKKETGKPYKMVCLAQKSDFWHGFSMEVKWCDPSFKIPDFQPGALVHFEYDSHGFIDPDCPMEVLNGR